MIPQHGEARVLVGIECVAERVEDVGAELDRVRAAELLEREADLELGRGSAVLVLGGTTGATVIFGVMFSDQLSSMPLEPVEVLVSWSVQTPGTQRPKLFLNVDRQAVQAREHARGLIRPGEGGRARGDRVLRPIVEDAC